MYVFWDRLTLKTHITPIIILKFSLIDIAATWEYVIKLYFARIILIILLRISSFELFNPAIKIIKFYATYIIYILYYAKDV